MMKLCKNNHNAIAFTDEHCPLCKANHAIKEMGKTTEKLDRTIWGLEGTVADLEFKLEKKE